MTAGCVGVVRAEDLLGLALAIRFPDVFDVDDGEHDAFGIAEGDVVARLELLGELLGDIERDRHRPERAVGESHLAADRFVVGLAHEAGERREAAVAEHLEVAELARREIPGGPVARSGFGRGHLVAVEDEINEFPTVWRDEVVISRRCIQSG